MADQPNLSSLTVVEVAMEIALPPDLLETVRNRYGFRPTRDVAMSTSVGGIGPLLRERIVAQAEKGIRVIGVTLLYETTWIQSWFEWGQLHLEKRDVAPYLRELLKEACPPLSLLMFDGSTVNVRVWQVAYGKGVVYFLDCPPITQVVYPNEEDAPPKTVQPTQWAENLRHQQSWLIGRGALALLKSLQMKPDLIIQSETPTIFAQHRLVEDSFQKDPFFENTRYIFNDHTPMEYAHPLWSKDTLTKLKVDTSSYTPPTETAKGRSDTDITRLLIGAVDGVFGVSQKHARVMRGMPSLQDFASKIEAITNGVLADYWQAPDYRKASSFSDKELLQVAEQKKAELLDWVWRHYGLWHTWKEQIRGKGVALWTRRITGYKRLDLLVTLCKNAGMKRQFLDSDIVLLIGGRIHQHDDQAQTMIYHLLDLISQDPLLQERIVFLDNFNVWMAPRVFQGADAAIMLADESREASATGFMKAQLNGDLIIATEDGAISESVIFSGKEKTGQVANGFEVSYDTYGHPSLESLLHAFKTLHDTLQNPSQRAAMLRSALAAQSQVSMTRSVDQMLAFYQRIQSHDSHLPVIN